MNIVLLLERTSGKKIFSMTCLYLYALGYLILGCFLILFFLVPSRELETSFVFIMLTIENVQNIEILSVRLRDRV